MLGGLAGAQTATLALGACGLAAGLLSLTLPIQPRPHDGQPLLAAIRSGMTRGVSALWTNHTLRAITLATTLGEAGIGALPVAAALLAQNYGSASLAGMLVALFAVGALVGSLAYARYPVADHLPELRVVVLLAGVGIPLLLLPATTGALTGSALFVVSGLSYGPLLIALLTNRERQSPADAHIQVFALAAGLRLTGAAAGAAVAGWFTTHGAGWVADGVALSQILAALLGIALMGGIRPLLVQR